MSLSKVIISFFTLVAVSQAKPVVTTSNVKAYLETVQISVVVDGKYHTYKLSADAFPSPSGEVRLVNPKLVEDRSFYGIEMDTQSGLASNHKAVLGIAQRICSVMELKPALTRDGQLDTVLYPSLFKSLRVSIVGSGGLLVYRGDVSESKKPVLSSIVCE